MMTNMEIVREMVKLQVFCVRLVERTTNLECKTHGDMDRILMGGRFTITYKEAINNLRINIEKYCKNGILKNHVLNLQHEINNSEIANLRFGMEPQRKFTELESQLDEEILKRKLFMLNEMVGISYVVKNLGLTVSDVKQACQDNRLLNTKKIGENWMVHIPECRAYWNMPDENDKHLYKNFIF